MSSSQTVLIGLWYDHSNGTTILTLPSSGATTLQAVIAIFVTFVGTASWRILSVPGYHTVFFAADDALLGRRGGQQSRFNKARRRLRVLMRNSADPFTTFLELAKFTFKLERWLPWPAVRRTQNAVALGGMWPVFGLCVLMVVCALLSAGWLVAGAVVAFMWTSPRYVTTNVRVQPQVCGSVNLNDSYSDLQQSLYVQSVANATVAADLYVKQCYGGNQEAKCDAYVQQEIQFASNDAGCPFDGGHACLTTNSTPVQFVSQDIDSLFDLGINAPVNATDTDESDIWSSNTTIQRFFYGPRVGSGNGSVPYTYEYSSLTPYSDFGYNLDQVSYFPHSLEDTWHINRTFFDPDAWDADVALVFLTANHIQYQSQVYDPVFATGLGVTETVNGETRTNWARDHDVSVLACIDQYQLCQVDASSGDSSSCSDPLSSNALSLQLNTMGFNAAQNATAYRIATLFPQISTYAAIDSRGAPALLASLGVYGVLQTIALPVDQWRLETAHWFAISLNKLQQAVLDFPTAGIADADNSPLAQYVSTPESDDMAAQCNQQLTNGLGAYVNFSWRAMQVVLGVGITLYLLGTFAPTMANAILACIEARRWLGPRTRLIARTHRMQWKRDDPMDLHSAAEELAERARQPLLNPMARY